MSCGSSFCVRILLLMLLRAILRQDPDVILVGEIRDVETAQIAIQASLTGHLVFSTLHTNSAAGCKVVGETRTASAARYADVWNAGTSRSFPSIAEFAGIARDKPLKLSRRK